MEILNIYLINLAPISQNDNIVENFLSSLTNLSNLTSLETRPKQDVEVLQDDAVGRVHPDGAATPGDDRSRLQVPEGRSGRSSQETERRIRTRASARHHCHNSRMLLYQKSFVRFQEPSVNDFLLEQET